MTNTYDNPEFFAAYAKMTRSQEGLAGAGEWPDFQPLLPALTGKRVLDLGCGYGWHCRYAVEHGAASVLGIDNSQRMLDEAARRTNDSRIRYARGDLATFDRPAASFDVVISSLAFHYVQDLTGLFARIGTMLAPGGTLLFTIEHPLFTAEGHEQWVETKAGEPVWPVDRYFDEGLRTTTFLGQPVPKYHHTLQTIVSAVLGAGLTLEALVEPQGSAADRADRAPWTRAPMMLIVRGDKPAVGGPHA
ncbi:class I SAM-dependent methyltransferase [Lacticaseibacillus kribbianus]|uniref:class I SAM-dependent methyltransferase n=1 Tax=Lacticaseibacillus kribbianus TaxID=2926292 RepID=UPI001CD5E778|nr:class I SAM-dependent methyltransferase [Lacticaseibacillus kribbianus]